MLASDARTVLLREYCPEELSIRELSARDLFRAALRTTPYGLFALTARKPDLERLDRFPRARRRVD